MGSHITRSALEGSFASKFEERAGVLGSFCLGLDPSPEVLSAWQLPDSPEGLSEFCTTVLEWTVDKVAIVKPQIAFFERHGSRGIAVLEDAIGALRQRGTLVILDAKRGDIGNTCEAYASAYFDPARSLYVDAITAHPYLGFGSLRPILDAAAAVGGVVFVVVASSNKEGIELQQARTSGGLSVTEDLIKEVAKYNQDAKGSVAGAVLGATRSDLTASNLRELKTAMVLCPGIGAQGADIADIANWPNRRYLIPTASRSILRSGRNQSAFLRALEDLANASKRLRE